jgi:uncharacterized C2H2 Zn-finger protein
MNTKIIEIEAATLEEAREQVKSQLAEGRRLLSEKVISDGKPRAVKAIADTTEEAFAKAQGEIPTDASVLERKEVATPEQKVVTVEAFDEQTANARVASQVGNTAIVKAIRLTTTGKQGFLGIGKKPNQYRAEVFQQAVVEIIYKTKAKISAEIGAKDQLKCPKCRKVFKEPLTRVLPFTGEQYRRIVQTYGENFQICPKCSNIFRGPEEPSGRAVLS